MARLNVTRLIESSIGLTNRINFVRRDPAVRKACAVAGHDIYTALRSTAYAVQETRSAWNRGGSAFGRVFAGTN